MQEKKHIIILGSVITFVFILFNSLYVLPQTQQAIVLQFGEPVRLVLFKK